MSESLELASSFLNLIVSVATGTSVPYFRWGVAGSWAAEVLIATNAYKDRPHQLPPQYKLLGFWITRVLLSGFAGLIVVAFELSSPALSFTIGLSAPMILKILGEEDRLRQILKSIIDILLK